MSRRKSSDNTEVEQATLDDAKLLREKAEEAQKVGNHKLAKEYFEAAKNITNQFLQTTVGKTTADNPSITESNRENLQNNAAQFKKMNPSSNSPISKAKEAAYELKNNTTDFVKGHSTALVSMSGAGVSAGTTLAILMTVVGVTFTAAAPWALVAAMAGGIVAGGLSSMVGREGIAGSKHFELSSKPSRASMRSNFANTQTPKVPNMEMQSTSLVQTI